MTSSEAPALDREAAWQAAAAVPDPELPSVTIGDLGILRFVELDADTVVVGVTPTYSGCPALASIRSEVERAVRSAGFVSVRVETVLAPAWTSDWVTPAGRAALHDAGIAPPDHSGSVSVRLSRRCPQCGSADTVELSRFGSTACKALWRCNQCAEPFDAFKVL